MSLFNEILQGRQQNLLTKFFNMVGGSPAPVLSPEIQPGLDIFGAYENDLAVLQGVRWCFAGGSVAAGGAGQYSKAQIRNGAGINGVPLSLVYVRRVWFGSTAAGTIDIQQVPAPATTPLNQKRHQDFRINPTSPLLVPPHDVTSGTDATAPQTGNIFGMFRVLANTMQEVPLHVVLPPNGNTALEIIKAVANEDLFYNFEYYYREVAPSELTL